MFQKHYKQCQSCGMPFGKDPQGGGTEKDGSRSLMYCSFCYQNGEFVQPEMTVEKMQELVRQKLAELKVNRLFAWLAVRQIPRLKRWQKK